MTALSGNKSGGLERLPDVADVPLQLRRVTPEDTLSIFGAAIASLGLTWLLYERILPLTGAFGFWLCWYLLFVIFYLGIAGLQWNRLVVRDKILAVLVSTGGIFATAVVIEQIAYSLVKGLAAIKHPNFWTHDMANAVNSANANGGLNTGGILHAAVGSLEQLALATLFSVPLGITAAVFLAEVGGRLERPVRTIVNAMTALPSIIAGLFIYALAVLALGVPKSGFAAALAISIIMLPTVTRAAEVVLQVVPGTLREASFALGASHWRTVWQVILPTARPGLSTAVVLAMARGFGETAPVLLVAGFTPYLNTDPFHGWQATLPTYILNYVLVYGSQPNNVTRAFGAGFALMLVVVVLFTIARILGGARPGELTKRQIRKLRREAARS
ncbi:MAG TPA: phosphate ABC transporter permease PstA [Streptosporangiaceae bacterium]